MSRRELNTANLLPCPTPVPAGSVSSMSGVRLVFCPVYQQCLDVAVRNDWEDWTCGRCPLARRYEAPSASELATRQPKE